MQPLNDLFHSAAGIHPFLDAVILFFAVALPYVMAVFTLFFLVRIHISRYRSSKAVVQLQHVHVFIEDTIAVLLSVSGAFLVSEILKQVLNTPRPYLLDPSIPHILELPKYASFPSSHTAVLAALALIIFYSHKRVGLFLLAASLAVGFARVMAGVHSVEDIIGGVAVGVLVSFVVATVRRHVDYAARD